MLQDKSAHTIMLHGSMEGHQMAFGSNIFHLLAPVSRPVMGHFVLCGSSHHDQIRVCPASLICALPLFGIGQYQIGIIILCDKHNQWSHDVV